MNKKIFTYAALGIVAALLVAVVIDYGVTERLETYTASVSQEQSTQRAVLENVAGLAARNGVDNLSESVLQDCTTDERVRFDFLLSRLDAGLTRTQLTELDGLFSGCGPFYSERKSLMVVRLQREFDVYASYTRLLSLLKDEDQTPVARLSDWEQLVALETAQAEQFRTLVSLQSQIIDSLLEGNTVNSPALTDILAQVREVRESQTLASTQARELRNELVSN